MSIFDPIEIHVEEANEGVLAKCIEDLRKKYAEADSFNETVGASILSLTKTGGDYDRWVEKLPLKYAEFEKSNQQLQSHHVKLATANQHLKSKLRQEQEKNEELNKKERQLLDIIAYLSHMYMKARPESKNGLNSLLQVTLGEMDYARADACRKREYR